MSQHAREIFRRHSIFEGRIIPDLAASHGSWLVETRDGTEYLDFFTYYSTSPLGHNHPHLSSQEFRDRLGRAAVDKPSLSDVQPREMEEFLEIFSRVAVPPEMPHLFFIDGGALAVENALKTAFDWKVRRNVAAGRGERGDQVLHFHEAFHGRSGYTLSLTNTADLRKIRYFPKFDWPRVSNPKCRFPLDDENLRRTREAEETSLREIRAVLEERGPDVAALILEPIQGEGGDNHFRPEFFRALREICDEHEIFFVLDEVQTGFGTTGAMWCYQHMGVTPDAVAFGKKTQVCGIMVSDRVDEAEGNVFRTPSRINSTWGGNLVDMVRAIGILEVMERDALVENARQRGEEFLQVLRDLAESSGGRVRNVRGRGLFCALDLPGTEERDEAQERLRTEARLLALRCGEASLRFRPSLTVTSEEIQEAGRRLGQVLA